MHNKDFMMKVYYKLGKDDFRRLHELLIQKCPYDIGFIDKCSNSANCYECWWTSIEDGMRNIKDVDIEKVYKCDFKSISDGFRTLGISLYDKKNGEIKSISSLLHELSNDWCDK